jgi:hypothetical protein
MPTWQYYLTKVTTLEGSLGRTKMKLKLQSRGCRFFFINFFLARYWLLDCRGCFGQEIKWDALSSFGIWPWPLEASHYAQPKAPIPIFYWLFSSHFFGLPIKFGHSILWPLNLDSHSVKQPLFNFCITNDPL